MSKQHILVAGAGGFIEVARSKPKILRHSSSNLVS